MKKIVIVVLLLHLLSFYKINAQEFCKTLGGFPNSIGNIDTRFISNQGPFTVRVFFHIIRRSNGTGGRDISIVNTAFNRLVDDYNSSNIFFNLSGSDYIDNDDFFNDVDDETCLGCTDCDFAQLTATNSQTNAINIYILPSNVFNAGRSNGIPGSALVIGGSLTFNGVNTDLATSHVLSHEMGHCLGLFHTFHGTCTCENIDCQGNPISCPELVNESNGTTCGDFVSDTPADPVRLFTYNLGSNCTWNNTTMRDANNQLYNPDETIIMAYTYPQCMAIYTNGEGERMRNTLATSQTLQPRIIPNDIFVQNETFSSGEHYLEAMNSIVAGYNVTTGTNGNVNINNSAIVEFRSHNHILLQPGVIIQPTTNGRFYTTIINDQTILKSATINSQVAGNYNPFLNNSTWFSVSKGFEGYINSLFTTEKDTIINDLSYSKIIEKFVKLPEVSNDRSIAGNQGVLYLREDIPNKRVYQYFKGNGDNLLYAFGLSVGAPLPANPEYQLKAIDSVEGPDGLRKRFIFKNEENKEIIWIEGVGNISYPFISDAIIEDRQKLICSSQNGITVYNYGEMDGITCGSYKIKSASISENMVSPFSLYPNPTKGVFRIAFNENISQIKAIRIIDINGKTISNVGEFVGVSYLDIDISSLPEGLYFCIINSDGNTTTLKVIKQ